MGYRSEVAIAMSDEAFQCLFSVLEQQPIKVRLEVADLFDCAASSSFEEEGPGVVFQWTQIKWYTDWYEELKFVEKTLFQFFELHYPEDYRFIRIGENYDDIEMAGINDEEKFPALYIQAPTIQVGW